MDLLIEDAAQACRVKPESSFLRPDVGGQVELPGRVPIHMAVEAGDAEARLAGLAVIGGIELLLRKRGQEELQPVELDRCQQILEQVGRSY